MRRREADWSDAVLAIQEFSAWVRNADTKSTILGGAVAIASTAALSQIGDLLAVLLDQGSLTCVAWVLACGAAAVLSVMTVCVFQSLRPRVVQSVTTRFAWPLVALPNFDAGSLRPETARDEAWAQAKALAMIAAAKYRWFSRALVWGIATIVLLVALSVVVQLHHLI